MSRPPDDVVKLSETLTLCEYKSGGSIGFWLYDKTRGMNLSMRAKTPTDAFVEALDYYQRKLLGVESDYRKLKEKVQVFVDGVVDNDTIYPPDDGNDYRY